MKKIVYTIMALVLITTAGCKKFVDGYDKSPNSPETTTPALLLTNCEVAYFATASGQLSRQTSMWVQQSGGVNFQSLDVNDYAIDEGTNTNDWTVIYANGLVNLKKLQSLAGTANPYYQGIAKIMTAMYLGIATDMWGDIPNKEALNGLATGDGFNPHFDAQIDVIADIQTNLSDGIALLKKVPDDNAFLPSADDLIYGGDVAKWIAAAHVVKARYYNRLSKKDPALSATNALTALTDANAAGFTSSASDCMAKFGTKSNEYNQWYAFTQVERNGYMKTGLTMTNIMNGWNDPRLPFYCLEDSSGAFNGSEANNPNDQASEVGPYLATMNGSFPLITYVEAKFIEAEAKFRKNDLSGAATAHNAAVMASVSKVTGASADTSFENAYAKETSGSISLAKIMTQKYVAMFGQIEVYADWRRTNFPALTPNSNSTLGAIPRRLPTVLEERLYNKNATVIGDIKKPVWWDE